MTGLARRQRIVLALALAVVGIAVGGVAAVARYGPLVDDAAALRSELRLIVSRVRDAGAELDAATLAGLRADAERIRERHARIAEALAGDPLVGLARHVPGPDVQIRAAGDLIAATDLLLDVMDDGLGLAGRFIEVRDTGSGESTIQGLVSLAVDAHQDLVAAGDRVDRALELLDRVPDGVAGPLRSARDEAREELLRYRPILGEARQASEFVPSFVGWERPMRYLVLPQNPAELRPTGGYIAQYGIVTFDRGRIVEMDFHDIGTLDSQPNLPHVEPPAPLRHHLLGQKSWRLGDSNWSPDFPTAARKAAAFYELESGGNRVDGVISLTTYAIDDLLALTGAIPVPAHGVTVEPGNATVRIMAATRQPLAPGGDRKAFLGVFGEILLDRLYSLPAGRWSELPAALEGIRAEHHAAVWLARSDLQAVVGRAGWDGALRVPPGDEVLIVEANVGPVSKLHLVTDRTIELDVTLDEAGNAHAQLEVGYDNHIVDPAADAWTRQVSALLLANQRREHLGIYVRVLTPLRARIAEASVDTGERQIGGLEAIGEELGRRSFETYAIVPPGKTTLALAWLTPSAVERDADGRWQYQLRIPKPAGRLADPLRVAIHLPAGAGGLEAPAEGWRVVEEDGHAVLVHEGPLRTDFEIDLRFDGPEPG